jgi:NAD(P)-dependent dehydrogenase (short-subunit alcohol dehydrogenase family)
LIDFTEKVAAVTGAASGIGREICRALAKAGAIVLVSDLDADGAEKTAREIREAGGKATAFKADVTRPEDVKNLIDTAMNEHGRLDYLFNNAGMSIDGEFQDLTVDHWKKVFDVNLWGTFYGCHYAYPVMMRQGFGHIVNTSSMAGLIPGGLTSCYSASKHAVVGLSLTLRAEAKQYNVKVSALCPGMIRTPILEYTQKVSPFMKSPKNLELSAKMKFPTPEKIMTRVMKGISGNKAIIVVPPSAKIYWYIHRIAPGFIPGMFHSIIRMMKRDG